MEIPTLKAETRKAAGSRAANRLRRDGKLPGIIYGHKIDPLPVILTAHDVALLLGHGKHLVNLDLGGQTQACLFKDAQYDHLGITLVHVDLARVDLNERVKVHVTIELRGTPKGVAEGGVLTSVVKDLEVECLVTNIPEVVRVDVSHLAMDQVLYVKDLKREEGVTILTDAEAVVAMVRKPQAEEVAPVEVAAEAAEGAAAAAEPEVISKGKVVEEGEGEEEK
jgi:large subunit ribosomal protein L25